MTKIMDPNKKNDEQELTIILDNFISDDNLMQDEFTQIEYSFWDDEWDNCDGDIILFV